MKPKYMRPVAPDLFILPPSDKSETMPAPPWSEDDFEDFEESLRDTPFRSPAIPRDMALTVRPGKGDDQ